MLVKRGGQISRRIPLSSDLQETDKSHDEDRVFPWGATYFDRIPFAENDSLKKITHENQLGHTPQSVQETLQEHPQKLKLTELLHTLDAEELDSLLDERKLEQRSAEWIMQKELVEHALRFFSNIENRNKIYAVTYMQDGAIHPGKYPDGNGIYVTISLDMLEEAYLETHRFVLERESLHHLKTLIKNLQKGQLIDGQNDRPTLIAYLEYKRDYWKAKYEEITEQVPETERKQYKINEYIYASFLAKALRLKTKEDAQLEKRHLKRRRQ